MPGHTPVLQLPYPQPPDPADVPADIKALADRLDVLAGRGVPGLGVVTVLPPAPEDGETLNFLADAAKGIVWTLRYRAAAPAPFRWEYLGGGPVWDEYREAFENSGWTYGTFGPLASGRPFVTLPLCGDYLAYAIAHTSVPSGSTAANVNVSPPMGSSVTADDRGLAQTNAVPPISQVISGMRVMRLPTGTALPFTARMTVPGFQAAATGGITYGEKRLIITPVRVG